MKLQYCHEMRNIYPLWNGFIRKQSLEQMNNSSCFCSHDGYIRIS